MENPIFITGIDRSGTSLLYALLGSHPNIMMSRRTNFWHYFYQRFGDLSYEDNFESCLEMIVRYDRLQKLEPDPEFIRSKFREGDSSYGRLLSLLLHHRAESAGKSRWGDKSLRSEHYAKGIFKEFPAARVIHIIRDPRDRYASVFKRYEINRGKAGVNTGKWLVSVKTGKRNASQYPKRYMMLRYESLVLNPKKTLKKLCDFIGEPYAEEMLAMDSDPTYVQQGGNSSFERFEPGAISTSPVARYRQILSPFDIAFIQIIARKQMLSLDYPSEPLGFSLWNWVRFFLIHFPLNLLRLASWYVLSLVQQLKKVKIPDYHLLDKDP